MSAMDPEQLTSTAGLREPTFRAAIRALALEKGSRGLDVGCGPGMQCLLLADEVGPAGHVTGLDPKAQFLKYGNEIVEGAGYSRRIAFKEGSAQSIPFADDTYDWIWSADCVGYGPWETMPMLKEMKRVTKPGGKIAILAWTSERLLPGYPLLEAKLSATSAGLLPFSIGMDPSRHFPRALGLLRELGLKELRARAFAGCAHAPLSEEDYLALKALIAMRWPGAAETLSESDCAEYNRLCNQESPDFILDHPDYYAFFTYSMFYGTVSRMG